MHSALDGGVLGRQPERIPAHGMQHVESARLLVARHDVAERVVPHMAHVDAARRIGKHLEHVVFRPGRIDLDLETRSEEHTSELQSLMRISYAVFCLKKKKPKHNNNTQKYTT